MHQISAQIESNDVRLCAMKTKIFDGYVKAGPSEMRDCGDETFLFTEKKRRVLSERLIKAGNAFRMEVSRACSRAGLKTSLGVLVAAEGLAELVAKELQLSERAAAIHGEMLRELEERGESTSHAKCEVVLIALRLTPDAEFKDAIDEIVEEATVIHLEKAIEVINERVRQIRRYTEVGDVGVANKHLRVVMRVLSELKKSGWTEWELRPLYSDTAEIREIILSHSKTVSQKLLDLDHVELMGGVSARQLELEGQLGRVGGDAAVTA